MQQNNKAPRKVNERPPFAQSKIMVFYPSKVYSFSVCKYMHFMFKILEMFREPCKQYLPPFLKIRQLGIFY